MSGYLGGLGWLLKSENILSADPAGPGNMNYTLRVRTSARTFILKQARPWVEKYPHLQAPWDRALIEGRFYQLAGTAPELGARLPKLLGLDEEARLLCLEDLGTARDFSSLYATGQISSADLETLLQFLLALHREFANFGHKAAFANREMRELNHRHIFVIPLSTGNGLDLDAITPGLSDAAQSLLHDVAYQREITILGLRYLREEGECLLHGDYFPGSWLETSAGVKVIDPEFCFFGEPEFDLGVLMAHLCLARKVRPDDAAELTRLLKGYVRPINPGLVTQYAGVEIMRRVIGVAQLPLTLDLPAKAWLLERSCKMVLHAA